MTPPCFAYLGPRGTYTDLALKQYRKACSLHEAGEDIACYSVSEVFQAVDDGRAQAGFVPCENMLQGPVTETLDLLYQFKRKISITDSFILAIEHALGTLVPLEHLSTSPLGRNSVCLSGGADKTFLNEITEVYSHHQALAQCSKFLRTHLNQATLRPVESTAIAIEFVKNQKLLGATVIASESSLEEQGFSVIKKDISDSPGNKTRFVVIRKGHNIVAEAHLSGLQGKGRKKASHPNLTNRSFVTSIVIDPGRDRQGLLYEILQVISIVHEINLVSIHSRPDARGGFVFHLDLEGTQSDSRITSCLHALEDYCFNATGQTTEISVLGCYPRLPFYEPAFDTIGIIGGNGMMGKWFQHFFHEAGFRTLTYDQHHSQKDLISFMEKVQVILLSVPISAIGSVMDSVSPLLRENQLVVENCSVKGEALQEVLTKVPSGVEVLGMHTMFGPETKSIRGQNVVITKTEVSGERSQAFEDLFYKFGAKISPASILEHDEKVAHVQSLTHLVLLSFAEALRTAFHSVDEIAIFSTPNTRALLEGIQRVLLQSDDLLLDIQLRNDQSNTTRHHFLETLFETVLAFDRNSPQKFLEIVQKNRDYFCASSK